MEVQRSLVQFQRPKIGLSYLRGCTNNATAIILARSAKTAAVDVLENRDGFANVFGSQITKAQIFHLGECRDIIKLGLAFKKYRRCRDTYPA